MKLLEYIQMFTHYVKVLLRPESRIRTASNTAPVVTSVKQTVAQIRTELNLGRSPHDIKEFAQNKDLAFLLHYAEDLGVSLGSTLEALGCILKSIEDLEESKVTAISGPKATVKLLQFLPLVGLLLGFLMGANPIVTLLTNPIGIIALAIGVLFAILGRRWTNRIVKDFDKIEVFEFSTDPRVMLTLIKSAVLGGASIMRAIECLEVLDASRIRLDVPFHLSGLPDYMICLEDAYKNGTTPIPIIDSKIEELNLLISLKCKEASEKLGVELVIPLGLCFLPSFICIGVVPIILSFFIQGV
jgi:tight adherence protein B